MLGRGDGKAGAESSRLWYRPFAPLRRSLQEHRAAWLATCRGGGLDEPDEARLFLEAVAGAVPLDRSARQRVGARPPAAVARRLADEKTEVLAELADLVAGRAAFDWTESDEYIEGAVANLDPRVLQKLRNGEFVVQGHLDLHGLTADQARQAVDAFLLHAFRAGWRCVLIVHGRGRNSRDQIPVLKTRLKAWLARGQWSRLVLAFTSARPCDGGGGALYLLLRGRRTAKQTIRVVEGAKR